MNASGLRGLSGVLRAAGDFFPRCCVLCGKAFDWTRRTAICPPCFAHIAERAAEERVVCPSCLRRRPLFADGICSHCRVASFHAEPSDAISASSLAHYEEPYARLIHIFKYGGVPQLARDLGALLALGSKELEGEYLVTWVPLSFRRWLMRGYSQERLLARAFARHRGFVCAPLLRKVRHNRAQATLDSRERRENPRGAYALRRGCSSVGGRRILLIDDVLTTGATTSVCAGVLLGGGASEVHILTLCCG